MRKRIMIDMDDVICEGGFMYQINKFLGTSYTVEDVKTYYMQELIPEGKNDEWVKYVSQQNIYAEGNVFLPDAIDTIRKLNDVYDVYIVTAYIFKEFPEKCGKHLYNKFECLCENLPFVSPMNFVFANNKEMIKCDIKIDDKLSNLAGDAETKLLFDAYHNRNISDEELKESGAIRVCTWRDIAHILLKN